MLSCILAVIFAIMVLAADQYSKFLIISNCILGEQHKFINGILNIIFVENRGAAWGILSGKKWILLCFTVIAMVICIVFLIKMGKKSKLFFWSVSLVLAGGIGNMIDRIFRNGAVIDFLQFDFWQSFPVFNIADCAIVIGGGLLILYLFIDLIKESKNNKESSEKNEDN